MSGSCSARGCPPWVARLPDQIRLGLAAEKERSKARAALDPLRACSELRVSRNRLTPSASLRSALPPEGEDSKGNRSRRLAAQLLASTNAFSNAVSVSILCLHHAVGEARQGDALARRGLWEPKPPR